jgi:hypothetical protein
MNDSSTLVYRAQDATEAALLRQALESAGVPATLAGGMASIGFGDLPADALRVDVWVPAVEVERARVVLRRWMDEARRRTRPENDWRCPRCGESNAESFQLCWSCGLPAPGGTEQG